MQKLTSILAVIDQQSTASRVLRKAAAIARHFGARLELLAAGHLVTNKLAALCATLGFPGIAVRTVTRFGRRLDALVLEQVERSHPDLVIKARAGSHPLRRCSLGPNDWRLAQDCPVPLMLVGSRRWASPVRLAAAVDVSDVATTAVARTVMQAAGFLALGTQGFLDVLYTEREQHDTTLRMERAVKLSQLVREFHVGCERLQMFDGVPEKRLPPLIAERRYDVLLLGALTHRDGLLDAWHPLTTALVDATPGDVVLLKASSPHRREATAPASLREQAPHQSQQLV